MHNFREFAYICQSASPQTTQAELEEMARYRDAGAAQIETVIEIMKSGTYNAPAALMRRAIVCSVG